MNVFEFSEKYKLSLAKVRTIKKDYPQIFDDADSRFDPARSRLAKGNRLTAMQLVDLIENPSGLLELGKHAGTAEREIAALGNPQRQVAPKEVVANIMEAARDEPDAVQIMVEWLRSIVPADPVEHSFIATRLILGIPATIRRYESPRIPRALLNARKHVGLQGWWHVEKSVSHNRTVYQKKGFDL